MRKRRNIIILSLAICVSLIWGNSGMKAFAATELTISDKYLDEETESDIKIVMQTPFDVWYQESTVAYNSFTQEESPGWYHAIEDVVDEGYTTFCVNPYVILDSANYADEGIYNATITIPVPKGYIPSSFRRLYLMYDWNTGAEKNKVEPISYTDTTVTFPIKMKAMQGEYVLNRIVYLVSSECFIEFRKYIDIGTLKGDASLSSTSIEYTGSAITPEVTIDGLTKDTDFTVSYSNNTNAGTAKAIVTGKGIYTGTLEIEFTISPISIQNKKADAKLSAKEFDYTGKAIEPEVTITGLTKDTDYTVAYDKNIDPGTATATITGKGNYKDSFTLEFTIKKAAETALKDEKTGAAYVVKTDGDTSEATYNAAKSKDEKTVTIPNTVTLPNGEKAKVTAVAKNACKGNKKLTKATIGNNVKSVGNNAFNGCAKLKTLKFGKRVEKIGDGAARNCKALKKVTIPASTKTIGKNAFNGDSNLKEITVNCKNLKSVGKNAIKNINSKAVIKLKGSAKQKKAAEKLITNKKTGYKKTMKIKK